MANPRNTVKFQGIQFQAQTFLIDDDTIKFDVTKDNGSDKVGLAVKLSGNATVAVAGAGDLVLGKLLKVEQDDKAAVQTGGYVTFASTGEIAAGDKIMGATGGKIAKSETAAARGIVVDASDADNVWVRLE